MNANSQEIMNAALRLSETERARIAEQLLESLSPSSEEALDDAWSAELDRRLADFEQSGGDAVPWVELKRQQ